MRRQTGTSTAMLAQAPQSRTKLERTIVVVRGLNVMIDADLAELYGVETRTLLQAVRRNIDRFPADFAFQMSPDEFAILRSQVVISRSDWGGRRYRPFAFTEQGVAMLSTVLRSPEAIAVNIEIMRAFVRFRRALGAHDDLSRKVTALEQKYDGQFKVVFDAIRKLMAPPVPVRRRIGLRREDR